MFGVCGTCRGWCEWWSWASRAYGLVWDLAAPITRYDCRFVARRLVCIVSLYPYFHVINLRNGHAMEDTEFQDSSMNGIIWYTLGVPQ